MGDRMVTCPMTLCDPKRSRLWRRYIWTRISRKRLEIKALFQWSTNRKPIRGIESSRDRWRHVTLKGQGRDPNMYRAQLSENGFRYRVGYNGAPIGNAAWGIEWSHAWWPYVTPKGQGRDPDIFEAGYLENAWRLGLGSNGALIGNPILVVTPIC